MVGVSMDIVGASLPSFVGVCRVVPKLAAKRPFLRPP